MKKRNLFLLLCLFLSACSYPNLIPSSATNSEQTISIATNPLLTPSQPNTDTPTLAAATFTETPTLIYLYPTPQMTSEIISTESLAPIIVLTANITGTPISGTGTPDGLFNSISISGGQIYWGSCEPSSVKITTHITDLSNIHTVTIWLRLENKKTGDTTDWGGGAIMNDEGQGDFSYTLTAKSFSKYQEYINAWGEYQLVASDRNLYRIGASAQYLNNITVAPCP